MRRAIAAVLAVCAAAAAAPALAEDAPTVPWTPEQMSAFLRRLNGREPFAGSREARLHGDSLGRFFGWKEYQLLRGNPVYGYWAEGNFRWVGERIAFDGIKPVGRSAHQITDRAWEAAFRYVARKNGWVVDKKAAIRVRGVCLGAVLDPGLDEPNRGVVLELRVESPSGPFLYRFGMGKPTIEDAIGASLDWALRFARQVNQRPLPATPRSGK